METKNQADDIILQIKSTEIKVEKLDDFHQSYYRNEYFHAFHVVNEILNQYVTRKERGNHLYDTACREIYNVIPFMGTRGSGKTSAMISFAGALKEYNHYLKEGKDPLFYEFDIVKSGSCDGRRKAKEIMFTCLDWIDGSLLEERENIFKVILAQMYSRFLKWEQRDLSNNKDFEYEKRELQQGFDKIYRNICKLEVEEGSSVYLEESAISSLRDLSSSLALKADFEKFVQKYLDILRYGQHGYDVRKDAEHFLVIVIDDLDLNVRNGFDMLEKIHRYMMVPNIIVLLAVDYGQLRILCEKNFYRMIPKVDKKLRERGKEAEKLARDFLDKVLPANVRIYMPQLTKCHNVKVEQEKNRVMNLKTTLFEMIYSKLGMRMDIDGVKRHFFEQNSLRGYVSFYLMLDNMEKLTERKGERSSESEFLVIFERNYRMLLSDILIRMVDDRLDEESQKVFTTITDCQLSRSCRNLFFHMKKFVNNSNKSDKIPGSEVKKLEQLIRALNFYQYSYGELLRIMYCWGRVDSKYKEIVRCLLAFYSLELTHSFYYYRYSEIKDIREEEKEQLLEILNGSFGGSWVNKMIPGLIKSGYEKPIQVGARKNVAMDKVFKIGFSCEFCNGEGKIEANKVEKNLDQLCRMFRSVVVLGMFFSRPHQKNDQSVLWELDKTVHSSNRGRVREISFAQKADYTIEIQSKPTSGMFNIMNFVSCAFEYEKNANAIAEQLYDVLFESDDTAEKESVLKKIGIKEAFEEWKLYSGGFALPIYDMDLCYNLMKRVRQRMITKVSDDDIEGTSDIQNAIKDTYTFIEDRLEANDNGYKDMVDAELIAFKESKGYMGYRISFKDAFKECPYIKWFLDSDKYLCPDFKRMFSTLVLNLTGEGNSKGFENEGDEEIFVGYEDLG